VQRTYAHCTVVRHTYTVGSIFGSCKFDIGHARFINALDELHRRGLTIATPGCWRLATGEDRLESLGTYSIRKF